jgi:hypothetical protein
MALTLMGTAEQQHVTQQTMKKLLDYWKHGRQCSYKGLRNPTFL